MKPKLPWVAIPIACLNLMFLWTSHTLEYFHALWIWFPIGSLLVQAAGYDHGPLTFAYVDVLALSTALLSLLGLRRMAGLRKALLFMSTNFFVFGCELAIFDVKEIGSRVTGGQTLLHLAEWFTNLDLLVVSGSIAAALAIWVLWPSLRRLLWGLTH